MSESLTATSTITPPLTRRILLYPVTGRLKVIDLPKFLQDWITQSNTQQQRKSIRKGQITGYQAKDSDAARRGPRINRPIVYNGFTRRSHQ